MNNRFGKLEEELKDLDSEGLEDVEGFGRLLVADHQTDPPPPTQEEWQRLPRVLKLRILAIVFINVVHHWSWYTWLDLACGKSRDGIK